MSNEKCDNLLGHCQMLRVALADAGFDSLLDEDELGCPYLLILADARTFVAYPGRDRPVFNFYAEGPHGSEQVAGMVGPAEIVRRLREQGTVFNDGTMVSIEGAS